MGTVSGDEDVVWARARDITVAGLEWLAADIQAPGTPMPGLIADLPDDERGLVVDQLDELRTVVAAKSAEFHE